MLLGALRNRVSRSLEDQNLVALINEKHYFWRYLTDSLDSNAYFAGGWKLILRLRLTNYPHWLLLIPEASDSIGVASWKYYLELLVSCICCRSQLVRITNLNDVTDWQLASVTVGKFT